MLTSQAIKTMLEMAPNTEVSLEAIDAILPQIDQQTILQQETARYRIEVKSFNALSEIFQQMMPCQDCFAFSIYVDDSLVMFQPHNPTISGHIPMTEIEANTLADATLTQLAKSSAESKIIAEVKTLLSL